MFRDKLSSCKFVHFPKSTLIFCSKRFRYPLLDTIADTRTSSISGTNIICPNDGDLPVLGPLPLLPSVLGVLDDRFVPNKACEGIAPIIFSERWSRINERGR